MSLTKSNKLKSKQNYLPPNPCSRCGTLHGCKTCTFRNWLLSIGLDDDVCILQFINTEVAPQPQPRGTDSWTVGALEVNCCDHCRGCSAVSLSGSCEFLASSLFEVGNSSVNRVSPFWSVHGISLQVFRIDMAPLEIGFDRVFIPQFWSALVSFASLEFPVHQASQHPTLLHSNHVSNPSKLGLDDGGLYTGGLSLNDDL